MFINCIINNNTACLFSKLIRVGVCENVIDNNNHFIDGDYPSANGIRCNVKQI